MTVPNQFKKTVFTSLDSSFDEIFDSNSSTVWVEDPVTFRTFVEDVSYMAFPKLSERQYAVADFMMGTDAKKIFDNSNTLAALAWGKGSGKDQISVLMLCYVVYVLLCMESPQKFFGLPEGEPIDLLNVAVNAEQANSIFFEKLRQRILRWKWLRDKYPIKMSGIFLSQVKVEDFMDCVVVTKNGIMFPKTIRAFSGHSMEASQEGKNLLCWTLDECSAFDETPTTNRAQKIFDMLRTSASSRFGMRWKGFCLSFPRYENDFILKLYETAQTELHWYSDLAATWEVKPAHLFKDFPAKYFEFEGQRIPLEFEQDFKLDPEDSRGKFMCEPPSISQAFIEQPEKVLRCVDYDRTALIDAEEYAEEGYVKKRITVFRTDSLQRTYLITIDLGLKSDSAALSIWHKEVTTDGEKIIQDYVGSWIPNKEKALTVSLTDIEDFILRVKQKINVVQIFFDSWNSALLVERLNQAGLGSDIYRLSFQDFKNFKESLYTGKIRLLNFQTQLKEMTRLILTKANKVHHPVGEHSDLSDTICGACKLLLYSNFGSLSSSPGLGGEFITQDNVYSEGGHYLK